MRNMSFTLTTQQIRDRTKTVTRREGWEFLQPGDLVMACVKCMGLHKGEKVERIRPIRILDVRKEPLWRISEEDVVKEGFPEMTALQFIDFVCRNCHMVRETIVNRIEFEHPSDDQIRAIRAELARQ